MSPASEGWRARSFPGHTGRVLVWPAIAIVLSVAFLASYAGSRAATPRPVTLVGNSGSPVGAAHSIDVSSDYATAAADVAALPDDGSSVEIAVAGLDFATVVLAAASITTDATDYSLVVRGKATNLFELSEQIDLLLLVTWGTGGAGPPQVSLGGYVPHNFDLSLLNNKFQYPMGQPEFEEVWFTEATGLQTNLDAYDGAQGFYPSGHEIPAGVAFRGELRLESIIGTAAATAFGYDGTKTVALMGVFATGTTIYNDKLTLQTDTTLTGEMDLSGVGPLFGAITFPGKLTVSLSLKTSAPNSQTGGVYDYGIKASITGPVRISKSLLGLGQDLDLTLNTLFDYSSQADTAYVTFTATASGPWSGPFGLTGFQTQSLQFLFRYSFAPSGASYKFVVGGTFTSSYVAGTSFDVSVDVTYKNGAWSFAPTITLHDPAAGLGLDKLFEAFSDIVPVPLPEQSTWSELQPIQLNQLTAQVRFTGGIPKVYIEARATVYGQATSAALYFGPDPTNQGKKGFVFAAHPDSQVRLGDLNSSLPADLLNVTLPDTIFYVSSMQITGDRLSYPTPLLFDFFDTVWQTSGQANDKITIDAGAGLVSRIDTQSLLPTAVAEFLRDALWIDINDDVIVSGAVPLFGKTGVSLTLYLPEAKPDPATPGVPEFFQSASFFLHLDANGNSLSFTVSGSLNIRLRKAGAPEPTGGTLDENNYDHLVLSASATVEVTLQPAGVSLTLQGKVTAPSGFHPFNLDWLDFSDLTLQVGLATTPGGDIAIKLGMRTKFYIGQAPDKLDIDASILLSVQTLKVFPWATVKLNGVRLKSDRGLETDDLLALADLFTGQQLNINVPPNFPNIAIRNFEISYADQNVPSLCLTAGFRIRGDLYVDPAPAQGGGSGPDCDPGNPPQPGSSCVGDSPEAQQKRFDGCIAGIDLEVFAPGGQAAAGITGSFAIVGFDIGQSIHFGNALIELILNRTTASLEMRGSLTIDGVGSGQAEIKFTASGLELIADARLFNAFWAHFEVISSFSLQNPTLWAKGYLQTEFGARISQALQSETANLRAALAALNDLVEEFQDPNNGLDDLASAIMTLPATLEKYEQNPSPALQAIADFVLQVDQAIKDAQSKGYFPSLDKIVNNILQGKTIVITEGVHGTYIPKSKTCIGILTRRGKCIGVWVYPTCTGIEVDGTCWLIPPVKLNLPGLCDLGLVDFSPHPCNSTGLKLTAADAIKRAFKTFVGVSYDQAYAQLQAALSGSQGTSSLFDVTCAAFQIDLGNGPGYNNELQLGIEIILLGTRISTGNLTWRFGDGIAANTTGLVRTLVVNLLKGNLGTPVQGCPTGDGGGPPPVQDTGIPVNLQVGIAPDPANEGSLVTLTASFDEPGVKASDTRTYTVDWGDGTTDQQTLPTGVTTFKATHVYGDDPVGTNNVRTVAVVVDNARAGSITARAQVTINNVAPTAGNLSVSAGSIDEGTEVTVNGSFTDPGIDDTHTVTVDWGDGSPPSPAQVDGSNNTFTAKHVYVDDNPTNTPQDTMQITATVTDDDGGTASSSAQITVRNVAPSATLSTEGGEGFGSLIQALSVGGGGSAPPGAGGGAIFHEGDPVTLKGTLTDPGMADLHRIRVDWSQSGAPVTQEFALAPDQNSFSATMLVLDDNPTGTPSDNIQLVVQVLDDDQGVTEYTVPLTIVNSPPTNVTVDLDRSVIGENDTVTATVRWADPGVADVHTVTVDWGDGSTPDQIVADVGEREMRLNHQYRDDNPSGTSSDSYVISATVTDDDTGVGQGATSVLVLDLAPVLETSGPDSVQYSDPLATPIVLTAYDVAGYPTSPETLTVSTRWSVNGSAYQPGLPPHLALTALGCSAGGAPGGSEPAQTCGWTVGSATAETIDIWPGNYSIEFKVTDDDGLTTTTVAAFTVLPEDAFAYYTGAPAVAAAFRDGAHLLIELRTVVLDISAAPGAGESGDPYPGDITHAVVTFLNRDTGEALCSAPVRVLFPLDPARVEGSAACTWTIDPAALGGLPASVRIGTIIGGWYTRDDPDDDELVRITGPVDGYLRGAGWFNLAGSAGRLRAGWGDRARMELTTEFSPGEDGVPELAGEVQVFLETPAADYRIDSTRLDWVSLACVGPPLGSAVAQLGATAQLSQLTALGPKPLDRGLRLQVNIRQRGDGYPDQVSFTLWGRDGELLMASRWTGTGMPPVNLTEGGFDVRVPPGDTGEPAPCGGNHYPQPPPTPPQVYFPTAAVLPRP